MVMWTYYQLTSLDGKNTPLAYFRYNGQSAEYYDDHAKDWNTSEAFHDYLAEGDPRLDKLDGDPTISKAAGDSDDRVVLFYAQNDRDPKDYKGSILLEKGKATVEGCAVPFWETMGLQGASDTDLTNYFANGWTNGYYYTLEAPQA